MYLLLNKKTIKSIIGILFLVDTLTLKELTLESQRGPSRNSSKYWQKHLTEAKYFWNYNSFLCSFIALTVPLNICPSFQTAYRYFYHTVPQYRLSLPARIYSLPPPIPIDLLTFILIGCIIINIAVQHRNYSY